ncbi:MAG: glycosyltransferase family 4 protein [Deltaproteobacteria bacterium]|nr:glycosyltransferase family 4 protein [Deltaproteobacteria bacterium]MBW2071235.1 glycosyltransferase family 4 protein [Deltaproteobacteria bacterium]
MNTGKNIGFVSTRFAGTDGVSLEAKKWAEVLERSGHHCYWFAGELDRDPDRSFKVEEAHFEHETVSWVQERAFGRKGRKAPLTEMIHALRSLLKVRLYDFVEKFSIDLLVAENSLTIPMHIALGLALTEVIAETEIPTIAHHHDFYWERIRFSVTAVHDYLQMAFPPNLPNIQHVVINTSAQEELALRTGISSTVIPNVLDFAHPPQVDEEYTANFRREIGLAEGDIMILQPTRIVQRKGIEHAIELVRELGDPKYKLVISHEAGDEGYDYANWLTDYAREQHVDLRLISCRIANRRHVDTNGEKRYTLWDVYPHADFITYPSIYEGFGNAFLEAVYFRKPLLINRYSVFVRDIEPQGFDFIVMDGFLTKKVIRQVREVLENPHLLTKMVNHNYEVAKRHYSYEVLRKRLNFLLTNFFGIDL